MYKTIVTEGLEYQDLKGMMKPTVHIDEFSSKMGDDDDIIVASFFVRSAEAAKDLVNWFEKGYDWILDADTSPGEIKPGRFLVYVEFRRRSSAASCISELLTDLSTLTEFSSLDQWKLTYKETEIPFSESEFERIVPLSPKEYRASLEANLNEMRVAAGIDPVQIYETDKDLKRLQAAAGL